MSEFEKLKIVTKYELLKQFRRRRFYGALGVVIFCVVLMIGLYQGLDLGRQMGIPEQFISQKGAEVFAMFLLGMSPIVALTAVFFAGDAIAGEFEHKTGYILFPNPVKRITLIIGKYFACFLATAVIISVFVLISAAALFVFYGYVPVGILGAFAIALALGACMISIAFAFSSVLKGGMGATIAALLTFMVLSITISSALASAGYDPWFTPDRAQDSMAATYGITMEELVSEGLGGFVEDPTIKRMTMASADPVLGFLVLLGYAVILFNVSVCVAKHREML